MTVSVSTICNTILLFRQYMFEPKFFRYCLTEEQVSEYKSSFDKWIVKSCKLGQRNTMDHSELNVFMKHLGFSIS